MQKTHSNLGFSIISIVIAVIFLGMVTGGVVFAETLTNSASAQKLVTKISKYDSATQTFITLYKTIPGDSKRLVPAGDDNGYLNDQLGVCDLATGKYLNDEKLQFWAHLSTNNMIEDEAYEAFSPTKCGGAHAAEWASAENSSIWPSIELNEKAVAVNGSEHGAKSPIIVESDKYEHNLYMKFKLNAEDARKFEYKFAEMQNAANIIELENMNGSGNCLSAGDVVNCDAENAGYAEYSYYLKK